MIAATGIEANIPPRLAATSRTGRRNSPYARSRPSAPAVITVAPAAGAIAITAATALLGTASAEIAVTTAAISAANR